MSNHATTRVVLDTNVFIAAFWNPRSTSGRILVACEQGRLELCLSPAILRELRKILRQAQASTRYRERIETLLEHIRIAEPEVHFSLSADPDDDKFLECAVAAGADYLITNDIHLLEIREIGTTRIIPPRRFPMELI